MSESRDAIKKKLEEIENERAVNKTSTRSHYLTRAVKAANSSTTNKPNTRSATKNKEDTALSTSNQALTTTTEASTTNTRKSIPRAAKDKTALATTKTNVAGTTNNSTTKRKSSTTGVDGRSSQRRKNELSVASTAKYAVDFKNGGDNRRGIAYKNEKKAIRTRGAIPFKVLMAVLAGWHTDICSPVEHTLDPQSAEAKRLLREGKEPQVSREKLKNGDQLVFQAIEIEETPADKETSNVADFATTMLIEASSGNSREARLRTALICDNDFKEASTNPSWQVGTSKEKRDAVKRMPLRFYKKDCLEKGGKNSFFGNGYTLREYYVREGKWNIEYIRSLGEDEETEDLLDALFFEEDAESVDELFE